MEAGGDEGLYSLSGLNPHVGCSNSCSNFILFLFFVVFYFFFVFYDNELQVPCVSICFTVLSMFLFALGVWSCQSKIWERMTHGIFPWKHIFQVNSLNLLIY